MTIVPYSSREWSYCVILFAVFTFIPGHFSASAPSNEEIVDKVREHYEELPYPFRGAGHVEDPYFFSPWSLTVHHVRRGIPFDGPMRILVAGGGTGDETVSFCVDALKHAGSEIVHLDLSAASIAIARRRVSAVCNLSIVQFVQGSILRLPELNLGMFDFISCSGEIHHLPHPGEGLRQLARLGGAGAHGLRQARPPRHYSAAGAVVQAVWEGARGHSAAHREQVAPPRRPRAPAPSPPPAARPAPL